MISLSVRWWRLRAATIRSASTLAGDRNFLNCQHLNDFQQNQFGPELDADQGSWQLDDSIQSKIIALAFSMAAEIERDLISQRTKEALRFNFEAFLKYPRVHFGNATFFRFQKKRLAPGKKIFQKIVWVAVTPKLRPDIRLKYQRKKQALGYSIRGLQRF